MFVLFYDITASFSGKIWSLFHNDKKVLKLYQNGFNKKIFYNALFKILVASHLGFKGASGEAQKNSLKPSLDNCKASQSISVQ